MQVLSIQRQFRDAIEMRDVDRVRELIDAGADVNARGHDPEGETPLMLAVATGDPAVVQLLIDAGANVNCAGTLSGWTPLMLARERPGIMRQLIAAGADVNARASAREMISPVSGNKIRRGGETALHLAAAANNGQAVRMLILAGADIEARAENGLAPLDYALKLGSPTEASVILVEAGALLTPQREEFMLSGAHNPESDLWEFPWSIEPDSPLGKTRLEATPSKPPPQIPYGEARCPKCGALLFSHRSRMCGHCDAILPPELVVTDLTAAPAITNTNLRRYSPAELARQIAAEDQRSHRGPPLVVYLVPAAFVFLFLFRLLGFTFNAAILLLIPTLLACYVAWRRAHQ
jgi:ankyrin repeat protein